MRRQSVGVPLWPVVVLSLIASPGSILAQIRGTTGTVIHVPEDEPTIQSAIDAATAGNTVLVSSGIYQENINFEGKAITVRSRHGARKTIIDGGQKGPVVTFNSGEGRDSILEGFTIRNGQGLPPPTFGLGGTGAGGIEIGYSSPFIAYNTVVSNTNSTYCAGVASAIAIPVGAPVIQQNLITNNHAFPGCGPIAAVSVSSSDGVALVGNLIADNDGDGVVVYLSSGVIIEENAVLYNEGAGINFEAPFPGDALIQNIIAGNQLTGLFVAGPAPSLIVNNTIADNGKGYLIPPFDASELSTNSLPDETIENNLFIATGNSPPVNCFSNIASSLIFSNNDVLGSVMNSSCPFQVGTNGNISIDPAFVDLPGGNFRLEAGSPAIGTGNTAAPDVPIVDLAGNRRISGGRVDIGAYEYSSDDTLVLSNYNLKFESLPIDSHDGLGQYVILTNQDTVPITILGIGTGADFEETNDCEHRLDPGETCSIRVQFTPLRSSSITEALAIFTNATLNPQVVTLTGSGLPTHSELPPQR